MVKRIHTFRFSYVSISQWVCYIFLFTVGASNLLAANDDYSTWKYSGRLYLNTTNTGANVSSDNPNFPVLIRLTSSNFSFGEAKLDGSDFRVAKSDGTHLPYEIERWDYTNKLAEVWVGVDTVYGNNSSQYIVAYWGKGGAVDSGDGTKVFLTADGHVGVWHLTEDPSGGASSIKDETSNAGHGTPNNMAGSDLIDGPVGKGHNFVKASLQYHNIAHNAAQQITSDLTISFWITYDFSGTCFVIEKGDTDDDNYAVYLDASGTLKYEFEDNGGTYRSFSGDDDLTTGWHHVALTFDDSGDKLYWFVDGAPMDTIANTYTLAGDQTFELRIGAQDYNGIGYALNGDLDEVRITDVERSADWIKLSYQNQQTNDSLVVGDLRHEDYDLWAYSKTFFLNTTDAGANVTGNVTAFPLLIRLHSVNFTFSEALAAGADIRFAKSDGTHLKYEIERWDATNSLAEIWVKVDTVYGNNQTQFIKMYWGKAGATSYSNPEAVYESSDSFEGVYHLEEDGNTTAGGYVDATSNNNDGTGVSMTSSSDVTGNIGTGQELDGSVDQIGFGDINAFDGAAKMTLSTWINIDALADYLTPIQKNLDGNNRFDMQTGNSGGYGQENLIAHISNSGNVFGYTTNEPLSAGSWYHLVLAYDGAGAANADRLKLYVNGTVQTLSFSGTVPATTDDNSAAIQTHLNFDGKIDEYRFASTNRSADYIKLSYMNQREGDLLVVEDMSEWTNSRAILLNTETSGGGITSTLTDFPTVIKLHAGNFTFSQAQGSGQDIRFRESDGDPLAYEIERWDSTNALAEIWVRIPSVTGNSTTQFITMHWGNAKAQDLSYSEHVFETSNNFAAVWHLSEDGNTTTDGYKDVTGNGNHGTGNSVSASTDVNSAVGKGQDLDGSGYINGVAHTASLNFTANATFSAWINADDYNGDKRIFQKGADTEYNFFYSWGVSKLDLKGTSAMATATLPTAGQWVNIAATYDGSNILHYIDGKLASTTASTGNITNTSDAGCIGCKPASSDVFNGILDEVRLIGATRTADWLKLEYMNQKAIPQFADAEDYNDWTYSANIDINTTPSGANVSGNVADFPFLVRFDANNFTFSQALDGGTDLRFAGSAGEHLAFEIERWDSTNAVGEVWVKMHSVLGNNNTQYIKMYWGNTNAVARSDPNTVFHKDDGFVAVYHLDEDGNTTASGYADATNNNYHGTGSGLTTSSDVTGVVGLATDFDGTNDYINFGNISELSVPSYFSINMWFNRDTDKDDATNHNTENILWGTADNATNDNFELGSSGDSLWYYIDGDDRDNDSTFSVGIANDTWYHLGFVYDKDASNEVTIYLDGSSSHTNNEFGGLMHSSNGSPSSIGLSRAGTDNWGDFDGTKDEIWISSVARSADFTKLAYENQKSTQVVWNLKDDLSDWSYSRNMFLNTQSSGANVSGNVINFPLLIRLKDENFDFTQAQGSGQDVRFSKSNGTDQLDYEIERWDSTNALAEIWVLVDTVYGNNSSHYITMYWGNSSAVSRSDGEAVFSTTNGFQGVWHLGEDGNTTADGYDDATANDYDGTGVSMTSSSDVTGTVGLGQNFDGTADYIKMGDNLDHTTNDFTLSAWISQDALNSGMDVLNKKAAGAAGYLLRADAGYLEMAINDGSNTNTAFTHPNMSINTWYHLAIAFDRSGNAIGYINGENVSNISISARSGSITNSTEFNIGDRVNGTDNFFDGIIDEARNSSTLRSADWIKLSYENQKANQSLVGIEDYTTWNHKTNIYINTTASGANTGSNVLAFPYLVRLDSFNFNFSQAQSNGEDVRFSKSDGVHIAYEIERWDATNEVAEIWVKLDTVYSANTAQYFTMYWGKATASDRESAENVFSVTDNFEAVWHLNEDGNTTSEGYKDATANNYHSDGQSLTTSSDVSAAVGLGHDLDGSADYIAISGDYSYATSTLNALTASGWIKLDDGTDAIIFSFDRNEYFRLGINNECNSGIAQFALWDAQNSTQRDFCGTSDLNDGKWHHVMATYTAGTWVLYVDGVSENNGSTGNVIGKGNTRFGFIGANSEATAFNSPAASSDFIDGILDEMRISTTARSADWAKLAYHNQRPEDFTTNIVDDLTEWPNSTNLYLNTQSTGAGVTGNVLNFPALVRLTSSEFNFSEAMSDGADIRFSKSNGDALSYEIERWDNVNKVAEIWVKVDTVYGDYATQYMKMYWGRPNSISRSNPEAVFSTTNSFEGVWHLGEDGNTTASGYIDATSNDHDGTGTSMTTESDVTGQVGRAQEFDGSADRISIAANTPIGNLTNTFTVTGWVNNDALTGVDIFFGAQTTTTNNGFYASTNGTDARFTTWGVLDYDATDMTLATGTWYHYAVILDASNDATFYINGDEVIETETHTIAGNANTDDVWFIAGISSQPWDGKVDEVRVSSVIRSANWINLSYENQKTNQTLVCFEENYVQDWSYKQDLTLNTSPSGANVTGDVNDFPVLVRLSSGNFDFSQAQGSGQDLRFTKSDGTPIFYEIERWDSTNAAAEVWVRVDTVLGTNSSQYIQMYWGNSSASSKSNANAVFDINKNWLGVWHLEEDGNTTASGYKDATSNAEHGTGVSMTSSSDIDGMIGRAQDFDGTNDYISTSSITSSSTVTVSAWVNIDNTTGTHQIFNQDATSKAILEMDTPNWSGRMYNGSSSVGEIDASTAVVDTWTHIAYTYDNGNNSAILYVNGSSVGTATAPDDPSGSGIGTIAVHSGLSTNKFDGTIDEVRFSKEIKSANWIKLEYENQRTNQTLVNFSSPATSYSKATRFLFNTTSSGAAVGGDVTDIPILVRIDSSHIDFSITKSDGSDILITDSSGAMLYHEVVLWDKGNDTALVWVKVPTVDGNSAEDYIDLHYGCGNCSNDFHKADSVWNGYVGVWHLNGGETSSPDVTSNSNDGTYNESQPFNSGITAPNAPNFNGSSNYISMGTSTTLQPATNLTIEAWMYAESAANWEGVFGNLQDNGSDESGYSLAYYNSNWRFFINTVSMSGNDWDNNPGTSVTLNTWTHISGTYDGANIKIYKDGVEAATEAKTGAIDWVFTPLDFRVGVFHDNNENNYFDGFAQEIRVSSSAHSADYLKLSYENQKLGSTFLSAATINGPVPVPGLTLWLRSDSNVTKDGNNYVTKWADISGAGNDAVQTNANLAALYKTNIVGGKPVLRFDGTDDKYIDILENLGTGNKTAFVVFSHDHDGALAPNGPVISFANAATSHFYPMYSNGLHYLQDGAASTTSTSLFTRNTFYIASVYYGTSESKLLKNNQIIETSSANTIATNSFTLALSQNNSQYYRGDIAEVLYYDRALNDVELGQVYNYLSDRYFMTPKLLTTLTASTNSSGNVDLGWTLPISSSPLADTIGIWAKLNGYPDSSRNGILVGYFPLTDTNYTWSVDYPGTWHFTLLVRDTNDNWSNVSDNAQDTAAVFGNAGIKLTFNTTSTGANVMEDQVNFPMLVRLVAADSGIFNACPNADGTHMRFIDDDGVTFLDYEVERYDNSSDLAEFWVRVPVVDGNSSTDFITMEYRMCDNPDASGSGNVFRTADNFLTVFHMNTNWKDATSNGYDGTNNGADAITGNIAGGYDFVATNGDDIDVAAGTYNALDNDASGVDPNPAILTISTWLNGDAALQPMNANLFQGTPGQIMVGNVAWTGGSFGHVHFDAGGVCCNDRIDKAVDAAGDIEGAWNHWTFIKNGTSQKIYLNGSLWHSGTGTNAAINDMTLFQIAGTGNWDGNLDEFRFSTSERSADWLKLCYETQKPSASVITQSLIQRIYVDSALGSNNNTCLQAENPSTPKRTLTSAVACAKHDAADTVRVIVQPGTYTDSTFTTSNSHDVMIKAADLNNPPIINGECCSSPVRTLKIEDKIHLRNLVIKAKTNNNNAIVNGGGNDNFSIVGCQIINNGDIKHDVGIHVNGTGALNIFVANNIIDGATNKGIKVESNNDVNVVHNVVFGGATTGLEATSTGSDDVSITNNIFYNVTTGISESDGDNDIGLISNNLFYNVTTQVSGGDVDDSPVTSDPLFISTTFGDKNYMKLSANSPAIDAGTNNLDANTSFSTHATEDLYGTSRPVGSARDIGVYEGTGISQSFTGEFDTLTTVEEASDTVGVHTSKWAIIFRKTEGGGIADLRDKDAWATNILGSDPLFDVNLSGTIASGVTTTAPKIISKNRVQAVVRQEQILTANFNMIVDYTIYPSGHIYIQSKIINVSGSTQSNKTLDYQFEISAEDAGFQNAGNQNGYGYLTTSTRDVYVGVTEDLNLPNSLTWDANFTAANNHIVWDTDDIDFNAGDEFEHHFLIYIGDESLGLDKSATIYNDTYYPQKLDAITGTPFASESWEYSLVGQWNFDEGAGSTARDISGNTRNGTITSATYTTGKSQTSLDFTTSAYVTVSHHADFDANNDRTYMAWVKKASTFSGSESDARFLSKGSDLILGRSTSANQVIFTAGGTTLTDPDATPNDTWFHIATTIDAGKISRLYVNGILKDVSSSQITTVQNSSDLLVGKNGANTGFDGEIDDVRIYHQTLKSDAIQAIVNEGFSHSNGAYRGRASNNNRFVGIMNQTSDVGRFQPVFMIDNWYGGDVPQYVYIDGNQMSHYTDFISIEEPHGGGGNTLILQLNKTITGTDIDVFIDDNDSSGFLGASSIMPSLHTAVTASDQITVKNLSGSTFGNVGSKEWEFIIDLDGSTGTTDGDGGIYSWKSSEISPNLAISSATDLTGSDSVTLDQMKFDNVALSGASWTSPDPNTYTINDSSSTRLKVTMGATTINVGTPDVVDARTYTFYPTGKIFISHSITSISAQPTTPQIWIERLNSITASTDATSSTTPQDSARGGKLSDSNISGSFHGFGVSVLSVKSNGTTVSGQTAVTGNSNATSAFALNFNNTYFETADATITVNYMIDFTQNYTTAASLDSALQDVQQITSLTAVTGSIVTNDAMDFNTDGFAEGEGVWTYSASSGVAEFKLNATQARFHPAFKISSWNSSSLPQIVMVNNAEQVKGYHYNATVDGTNNALIIQFNKVFTGATNNILISQNASLAVTLSSFSAIGGEGVDTLKWTTESEIDNLGFYVLRRIKPPQGSNKNGIVAPATNSTNSNNSSTEGKSVVKATNLDSDNTQSGPILSAQDLVKLDSSWKRLNKKLVPGPKGGRSSSTRNYLFIDRAVKYEVTYEYILVSIDVNSLEDFFGPVEAMPTYPSQTKLYGNYPNPFNPMTNIRFDLRAPTKMSLKIYDIRGHLIRTLISPNKALPPGQYRYTWDAKDDFGIEVPSGHYIYMFVTPKYKKARKMTLLK